jgi:putative hydrolase of the HAD superfamily
LPAALPARALAELVALDDDGYRERGAFCAAAVARFPLLGMSAAELEAELASGLAAAVEPRAEVLAALAALGRRFRLGVVSNGGAAQRVKLERAGLAPFFAQGRVLISGEVGLAKPDARLFALALAALELPAGRVLHVGDDLARDVAGAHAAGLRCAWVARGRRAPPELPPRTLVVDDVAELPARLARER